MIALAIASVMSFSSCSKEEKTEIVDPLAGKHEIEVTLHAEVTGSFTKAVAIEVEYTDFDGKAHKEVVNSKFDGQNAVFNTSFKTIANGVDEKEATIHFKGINGDIENYKSETSPWGIKCSAIAKLDGNVKAEFNYERSETKSNQPLVKPVEGSTMQTNNAYLYGVVHLADFFTESSNDKSLIITAGKKVTFTNWPSRF